MTTPESPSASRLRRPSWLDLRLVLGVILVLVSVLAGARVVSSADHTVQVWAAAADLATGTVVGRDDLRQVRVRLVDNAARYLPAGRSPVGRTLSRPVGADELIAVDALTGQPCGSEVSIPVGVQHVPAGLRKGQRIDVFATGKGTEATTDLVLRAVTVQSVRKPQGGFIGADAQWSVIVLVRDELTASVVKAVRTAEIDVTVVGSAPAGVDGCGAAPEPSAGPR